MKNKRLLGRTSLLVGLFGAWLAASPNTHADYATAVSDLGPVVYYRFNDPDPVPTEDAALNLGSLGEAFNGEYQAMSGSRGMTGAILGDVDKAVSINGAVGQQVVVPFAPEANPNGPFTVEVWAQPADTGAGARAVAIAMVNGQNPGNADDRSGWCLRQSGVDWQMLLGYDYSDGATYYGTTLTAASSVTAGVWQHLVAVYDGSTISLYINGNLAASAALTFPMLPNTGAPIILGDRGYTGWDFNGLVDEFAVYPTALSAAVVKAHYDNARNAARPQPYPDVVLQQNPVVYLRLGEGTLVLPVARNSGSLGATGDGTYFIGTASGAAGLNGGTAAGFESDNTACAFDGATGFVGTTIQNLFDVPRLTLMCWFKPDGNQPDRTGLFGQNDVIELGWHNAQQFGPWTQNGGFPAANPALIQPGLWNHFAAVADGTTFKLFLNGAEAASVDSSPATFGTAAFNFNIGGGGILDAGGNFFRGMIDEVAVFNKALEVSQIQGIYNAALPAIIGFARTPAGPIYEGATVTLEVKVAGSPPFNYQWRKDGTPLAGQSGAVLTLTNVQLGDSGDYDVQVTQGETSLTSPVARLEVQAAPPAIVRGPTSVQRFINAQVAFTVETTGSQPLTIQWQRDGNPIPGANSATLHLTDLQSGDAGEYTVVVSNPMGSDQASATLSLESPTKFAAAAVDLGPYGYWPLNETSGTTAFDYWGGRDGTANSGVTRGVDGPSGATLPGFDASNQAYSFNGNGGEVVIPPLNINKATVTIVAWIRPNGAQDDYDGLVFSRGGSTVAGLDYQQGGQLGYHWNDAEWDWGSQLSPTDGVWNFVALVVEPSQATMYWDDGPGLLSYANIANHDPEAFDGPLRFGADGNGARYFNGAIDEVAIYDRALSETQISALHAAGFAGTYVPAPVQIVEQPKSETILAGRSYTLSGKAAGSVPLTYRWQKNGADIPGATRSSLTFASVAESDSGTYQLFVTQGNTVVSTAPATLTVKPRPTYLDLSENLVVHLKFDGDYQDASGRNNHGTPVGGPSLVDGKIGSGALRYATVMAGDTVASASYVSLGSPADLQFGGATSFSVAFWTRFTGSPGDLPFLCNNDSSYGGAGYTFAPSWETGSWSWSLNDGPAPQDWPGVAAQYGDEAGYPNVLNDGNWHHLVFIVDRAGEVTTYLDGAKVHTKSIAGLAFNLNTGMAVNIGQAGGNYPVGGQFEIDDLGIWRAVLTDADAQSIYIVGQEFGRSFDTTGPAEVTMQIRQIATGVEILWPSGRLESAPAISGPWGTVSGANAPSHTVTPTDAARFYRVR
jgi:hypothetical protein